MIRVPNKRAAQIARHPVALELRLAHRVHNQDARALALGVQHRYFMVTGWLLARCEPRITTRSVPDQVA